jgi:hypothetical protein
METAHLAHHTEKRALQITVAVLAAIPAGIGAAGIATGTGFLDAGAATTNLDSHFRYLSGIFFALGCVFYACVPAIERKGALFALAAALVVTGGLARLIAFAVNGAPSAGHIAGLCMELIGMPLLVLWQRRVAKAA